MFENRSKNEKSIYHSCTITMVGPKIEIKDCDSLLRFKTTNEQININKKLVDTLNLLVATYELYCDRFPNAADIIKYAMDIAHTGLLCNCPELVKIDKNLEGVEVVLNFINNIMIENKGTVKWGETYFSYQAPKSEDYLKNYPYKFKETYDLFTETIYPDTVINYMYRLEQKSIEELFDNGEVNSDKIDYMASEYYNGDYEVCGFLRYLSQNKYNNNKVIRDDRYFRHNSSYNKSKLLSEFLYSHIKNSDDKSIRTLSATYTNLRSIPLDMVLALSFKYDNSYFAIQYIDDNETIKTYIFNNGNIVTNDISDSIKKEFLIKEVVELLSDKYYIPSKTLNSYIKEFKYIMLNNFNEGVSLDEFMELYVGPSRDFQLADAFLKDVEKCLVDTDKPRKMFFGKTSSNKIKNPKKLYKKTYSDKSVEVYNGKKMNKPKTIIDPFQEYVCQPKINYEDEQVLKYREEKLKDFK